MSQDIEDAIARGRRRLAFEAAKNDPDGSATKHAQTFIDGLARLIEEAVAANQEYAEVPFPASEAYACNVAANIFAAAAKGKRLPARVIPNQTGHPERGCKVRIYWRKFQSEDEAAGIFPEKGWTKVNDKRHEGTVNGRNFRIDIVDTGTGFWTAESVFLYLVKDDGTDEFVGIEDYEHNHAGEEEKAIKRAQKRAMSYVPKSGK